MSIMFSENGVINKVCLPYLSVVGFSGKVQGSYGIKCQLVNVGPCAQELSHHVEVSLVTGYVKRRYPCRLLH